MIVQIRVDDRLIHGQVAVLWSKHFGTTHIVVANDAAANNEVQRMTLKIAAPNGVKVLIKGVDDSIKLFHDPRSKDIKLFVLTDTIQDALKIAENCDVKSINVANVGRFDSSEHQIKVNSNISCNAKEFEALKKVAALDIETIQWIIPAHNKFSIKKLLENMKED